MTLPVLLALLASLAPLAAGGARADSESATTRAFNASCGHDGRPTIAATTATNKSYRAYEEKIVLVSMYGEEITVFCANAVNLTILNHKKQQLPAKVHNSTTIVSLQKPDVGEHTYYCTDSHTRCDVSLTVTVHPAVTVTASNVHHTLGRYWASVLYFVPLGENYDVFCSAHEVETLFLANSGHPKRLKNKDINATTVITTVTNDPKGRKDYVCRKNEIKTYVTVIVDHNPEARDFRCIFLLGRKLECSWTSSSKKNTFSLSMYVPRSNGMIPLCSDMSGALSATCARAWNDDLEVLYVFNPLDKYLSLQLETCNEVFCQNQTYEIKMESIIKVDPVYNLELLNINSSSAEIAWHHSIHLCTRDCDYKVKYRLGTQWRQADLSTLQCYDHRDVWCNLQLALPCANSHYEMRVYVKPRSSIEDRYWSEPAAMSFFNTPAPGRYDIGPMCDVFRKPETTPAANAVLHEVRELIGDLKLHINQKMAEIEALMDTQAQFGQ